jgi:RNA polymerase sigma-70 factor (family 1)
VKHYLDAQLLQELKNDDHQAFKELYDRYADKLIAVAIKKTSDEDDAMDLVQELFLSLWKNRKTIQLNGSLAAYLTVSVNYMSYKTNKRHLQKPLALENLPEEQEKHEDSTLQKVIFSELNALLNNEISSMPEKMRQVYLYSREMDMNGLQIAAEMGVSHQTVRNQISNALTRLKKVVLKYNAMLTSNNIG